MKSLNVLITSGGTISKIDDVRYIGNFSKGTTGALIAEEFLKKGDRVYYFHSKNARKPFRREIDYSKKIDEEIEKVKQVYKEYKKYSKNLQEKAFSTFDEYYAGLKNLIREADVVVLAAAVSDYSAKYVKGKISSDLEAMSLKLERNPKAISLVKKWKPEAFQVGFKLLVGVSYKELVDKAYEHGNKSNSDITIANTLNNNFEVSDAFIITPEKQVYRFNRENLAARLVELVHERYYLR